MLSLIPRLAPYRYIEVPPGFYSTTRSKQLAFVTNEPIEDVKEQFLVASGSISAATANHRYTTSAAGQYLNMDENLFGSEDFTIQLKVRLNDVPTTSFTFLGAYANMLGTDTNGSWLLLYEHPDVLALHWRDATNTPRAFRVPCLRTKLDKLQDHHIEVGRRGDTTYFFLNGELLGTALHSGGTRPQTATLTKMTMHQVTPFAGQRWDVAIDRGICLHTAPFQPAALPVLARTEYTTADAKLIRAQMEFRRDSIVNEANGCPIYMKGTAGYNSVVNGRMKCSGSTSPSNNWSMSIEPFGAADFTVECTLKLSGTPSLSSLILGHLVNAANPNISNRWYFLLNSSRRLSFVIRDSETLSTTLSVAVPINMTLGIAYKVIVERYNNVLTMYLLDALTGDVLGSIGAASSLPIQGAKPFIVANYVISGDRTLSSDHTLWDVRIADKAMYKGVPLVPATFPAVPLPKYTDVEAATIVSQVSLRRSSREEKTNKAIPPSAPTVILNNSLNIPSGGAYGFTIPKPDYFGAGDFTIECRLTFNAATALTVYAIGQFDPSNDCSWCIRTASNRFGIVFSKTGAATGAADVVLFSLLSPTNWVVGVEYFLVCERVGATTTLYIDGVAVATSDAINFPLYNTARDITRGYGGSVGSGDIRLRDIRISKIAQYAGAVPKVPAHKLFAVEKPSFTMGYINGGTGTIYGYMENSAYSTANISLGSCSHKLFVDSRSGAPKVKRLKGLFIDRAAYLILCWEDTTLTPTADMPIWTNTLVIDGIPINIAGAPVSGFSSPLGGTSCYVSAAAYSSPLEVGRQLSFEFI